MAFQGFTVAALDFFDDLEADNTKSFWLAHKEIYDEQVLAPMQALLTELEPTYGEWKIFRPYRDVRFSKDKTPYKTNIGARIGDGYVQIDAGGLMVGSGRFHLDSSEVARFRAAVDHDLPGEALEKIVKAARRKGYDCHSHDQLKTVPRGFAKEHPRAELLKYKGLIVWGRWESAGDAKQRVKDLFKAAEPLNGWLRTNVG